MLKRKNKTTTKSDNKDSVIVAVRVRPFSNREITLRANRVIEMPDEKITQIWSYFPKKFASNNNFNKFIYFPNHTSQNFKLFHNFQC